MGVVKTIYVLWIVYMYLLMPSPEEVYYLTYTHITTGGSCA